MPVGFSKRLSALQATHHDGLDHPTLQREKDEQDGQDADHRSGGEEVILDEVHVGEAHQAHGDHLHLGAVDHHHRPEELVPVPHELDDQQGGHGRLHRWQNHREEDSEFTAAVDAGRVDVVVGNHLDSLPHQEDAEDADQVRGHDAHVGVEQPEAVYPDVQRHHDRLEGDHQDADDGEEEDVPSGEAILRESEPRQRRDHQAAHGGDRGDDSTIQQVAHEGFALEDFEVVGQVEPVVGGNLERHALDLGGGFQRGDRHPEEGEKDRDGAAGDREGDEPAEVDSPDGEGRAGRKVTRWSNGIHVLPKAGSNIITKDPSLALSSQRLNSSTFLRLCLPAPRQFFSTRRVFGRFAIAVRSPPGA